jgi:hydroxyethylthiazole kinase-like uncharacterized protein yjeF
MLRRWPLPAPAPDGDKEDRGRVLVVGGSREMPGSVALTCEAALRAGAGKVQVLVPAPAAPVVAGLVPEAWVGAAAADRDGGFTRIGLAAALPRRPAHAAVIGPGLGDERQGRIVAAAMATATAALPTVVDAMALDAVRAFLRRRRAPLLVTPHAGEMASLCDLAKARILADPLAHACRVARELGIIVLLKGAATYIAVPDGGAWRSRAGSVGLATAGSGDVLAGIIGALLARGADPAQAAVWGAFLHGRCGTRLARRRGPLGFLARELAAELPGILPRWRPGQS